MLLLNSGFQRWIPNTLISAAGLAAVQGYAQRAAQLFGAAEALREALEIRLSPSERERYKRDVAIARSALDPAAFAASWAEGRAFDPEEAVRCALGDA